VVWGEGGRKRNFIRDFWEIRILTWSVDERNGERSMYFVCDFNGS